MALVDFLARWLHVAFGILWIGLLYYFNFVQGEYFKEATDEAKKDATQKLVPRALWYFRWAAMLTFLTGVILLEGIMLGMNVGNLNLDITFGALMGTIMMLNVWLVIWPNQKKVIAGAADAADAAARALAASRTNTLFSLPMLYCMVASAHNLQGGVYAHAAIAAETGIQSLDTVTAWAAWLGVAIIALIEVNAVVTRKLALFGVPLLQSVVGVIHSSLVLTLLFALLLLA